MEDTGRLILKAIFQKQWLKINYRNLDNVETTFMVGFKKAFSKKQSFFVDSFNLYLNDKTEERFISFNGILSAEECNDSFYDTPKELLSWISGNREEFSFLFKVVNENNILDYYRDCFLLDSVPYKAKYGMFEGIDDDVLMENKRYSLTDKQFAEIFSKLFEKNKKKGKTTKDDYALNVLSIVTKKGLYVLMYRSILLDIKKKELIPSDSITINKEFTFDSTNMDVKQRESYSRYLPEEDYALFDEPEENLKKIVDSIKDYCKTNHSTYENIDTCPNMFVISRNNSIDLNSQLQGIKKMVENQVEMTASIKVFFGGSSKSTNKKGVPIFVADKDRYNVDQINAINQGMISHVSYIQGPPGTGKTETLLNAILTAEFNGKTVLVCSNNNIPMDGVYEGICKLKYHNNQLLFPAIRLGNSSSIEASLDQIVNMYEKAKKLTPIESQIKKIKDERKDSLKNMVTLLSNYSEKKELVNRKKCLEESLEKVMDEMLKLKVSAQIEAIEEKIKQIGETNLEELSKFIKVEYESYSMAVHYETASRLQKLSKPKYAKLFQIISMPSETEKEKKERSLAFKKFLSDDASLALFLDIFPVIISTNLSCTYMGEPHGQFDYVMMDEAGQCNVANALIPIVRGKRLILIGDPQQLSPVIVLDKNTNQRLRDKYHIPDEYDYINNSIYTTFTKVDILGNETLLSYHYRCNNKIINFSNQKYYNHRLQLFSKSECKDPLKFVDTSIGDKSDNTNEKNISRVEAKYIVN